MVVGGCAREGGRMGGAGVGGDVAPSLTVVSIVRDSLSALILDLQVP